MAPLIIRSWRAHRTAVERLMGADAIYVAEISDGYRSLRARGPTRESSIEKATSEWKKSMRPK
jgi:hypothetical protein